MVKNKDKKKEKKKREPLDLYRLAYGVFFYSFLAALLVRIILGSKYSMPMGRTPLVIIIPGPVRRMSIPSGILFPMPTLIRWRGIIRPDIWGTRLREIWGMSSMSHMIQAHLQWIWGSMPIIPGSRISGRRSFRI